MKLTNEYSDAVLDTFYYYTPKAVWAAVAVSLMLRLNGEEILGDKDWMTNLIRSEWQTLYDNGIVPQKPWS